MKKSRLIILSSLLIILIFSLIASLIGMVILKNKHYAEIERVITDQQGIVLDIHKVDQKESAFSESSSGNVIYKIVYEKNGSKYIAWYRGLKTVNDIHKAGRKDEEEMWIF